jgi:septal ring factor EnvC (AmiA/AmiB activator)
MPEPHDTPGGDRDPARDHAGPDRDLAARADREVASLERQIDLSLRRADDAASGRAVVRRRSPGLVAALVVVILLLLASAGLAAYLWRTTDQWRAEADRRGELATSVAAQRDQLAGDLSQAERDLEATESQLLELQDRLLSLADERAQTGDELELTRMVANDVASVASQLEGCARGQDQLIDQLIRVLEELERYDPASVAEGARQASEQLNTVCDEALQATENLRQRLGVE